MHPSFVSMRDARGLIRLAVAMMLVSVFVVGGAHEARAGTTLYVDFKNTQGPWLGTAASPYNRIQAALDAAPLGSTVYVARGTYRENVDFKGKNVTLRSSNPLSWASIQSTVIDGGRKGPAVKFLGSETAACVLTGFTITNGQNGTGGGIAGNGTDATIQNNYIVRNVAYSVSGTMPRATVSGAGGGLAGCNGLVQNNVIAFNTAGGPVGILGGNFTAGAIYQCDGVIRNNTIWGNRTQSGGMSLLSAVVSCQGTIRNNIVWKNEPLAEGALASSTPPFYCLLQGGATEGTGNISADPQLNNPAAGDFRLAPDSPCIDAGGAVAGLSTDIVGTPRGKVDFNGPRGDGSHVDIGAYEYLRHRVETPVITPASGGVLSPFKVTVTCALPGATLRYTLNGDEPTTSAPVCTGVLVLRPAVGRTITLKVKAFKAGYDESAVASRSYSVLGLAKIYVDAANTAGPWDGSAAHPCRTINDALALAGAGAEIYVATGKYLETVTMKSGVKLYGGYPRGNYSSASRNPAASPTTITLAGPASAPLVTMAPGARLDGFIVGGVRNSLTYPTITNSLAGGIYCENVGRDCVIANCTITRNLMNGLARRSAVNILVGGGGIALRSASPTILNCVIAENRANRGGGILCINGSDPLISGCVIRGNCADGMRIDQVTPPAQWGGVGGGVTALTGMDNPLIQNCVITANEASFSGGGLVAITSGTVVNCTISGNRTGLVQCGGTIMNCIVWGNRTGQLAQSALPSYSCIQGWTGGGTGNISADPKFVNAGRGDFHLRPDSSCLDAGARVAWLVTDIEGTPRGTDCWPAPRGDGSQFDIGAYEMPVAPPVITQSPGPYPWLVTITMKVNTPGAVIRYTIGEAPPEPNAAAAQYASPLQRSFTPGRPLIVKAKAFKAGLLESATTTYAVWVPGVLISSVSRSGIVADRLAAGKLVYGDRNYTFAAPVPAALQGQLYLRTFNGDKALNQGWSFTVDRPVRVYVALSGSFGSARPAWMTTGWTAAGDTLKTTDAVAGRKVYVKSFPAGVVTLGPNLVTVPVSGWPSMYSVIVTPQ